MKALSIWNPWAAAVALQSKRIETRSWSTSYRGPIAIHAAKRCLSADMLTLNSSWTWLGVLRAIGKRMGGGQDIADLLAFGAVVAVGELTHCRPTGSFTVDELDTPRRPPGERSSLYEWTERQLGDFTPGRFGLVIANVRRLATPVPFVGKQRLFEIPDELLV